MPRGIKGSRIHFATVRLLCVAALFVSARASDGVAQTPGSAAHKSSGQLPRSCLVQQHPSEEISALLETVRGHPTAGAYNTLGALYARDGRVTCAVSAFEAALHLDHENWQSHYNLGLALVTKGDRIRAATEFRAAIRYKPDSVASHIALGSLLQDEGKLDEASQEFRAALQIDPNFAFAYLSLGVVYTQQGKDSEAAVLFRQAVEHDAKNVQAHENLGLALARQGQFVEAEQEFRSAIELDPENPEAYTSLGMLQAKTGRGAEAVEIFRKVVALQPNSADAHVNLGIALVDQYDRLAAFDEFTKAAHIDPNSPGAHYNLGRFYFETSKYDEARRELETSMRLQPNFAGALYFLALTERQVNHVERATELLQKVVTLQPENADAQYLLGQYVEHAGKTADAIAHWKLALQADSNQSEALYNLARALNKLHDPEARQYQDRFEALQKAKETTNRVGQLGNFAIQAANAQNWPQALQEMNEAIAVCGQCEEAAHLHRNLGLMYCRTGNLLEGEKELRAALQLDPNDAEAKKALAVVQNLQANHKNQPTTQHQSLQKPR